MPHYIWEGGLLRTASINNINGSYKIDLSRYHSRCSKVNSQNDYIPHLYKYTRGGFHLHRSYEHAHVELRGRIGTFVLYPIRRFETPLKGEVNGGDVEQR